MVGYSITPRKIDKTLPITARIGRILDPFNFLCILSLTVPFQLYINLSAFPLSTAYILIGIIFVLWALAVTASNNWKIFLPREVLTVGLLLLFILCTSLVAADKRASLILGVQLFSSFLLFFATANLLNSEKRIRLVVKLLIIGGFISSGLGIIQAIIGSIKPIAIVSIFYTGPLSRIIIGDRNLERLGIFGPRGPEILYRGTSVEGVGDLFRGFGLFEGPTVYGWFTATVAILAFGFWLTESRKIPSIRRKLSIIVITMMVAILLSWVRSAWLALIIGLVFIIAFRRAKSTSILSKRWSYFILIGCISLGLLILFGNLFPQTTIGKLIISAIGGENAAGSNAGRLQTARFALDYLTNHPFIGVGFGNYAYISSGGKLSSSVATFATAHNTFLELGVELGILGLIAFLVLLYQIYLGAQELVNQEIQSFWHRLGIASTGVLLSFIIIFMFGGNIIHPKWMTYWWIFVGILAAARHVYPKDTSSKTK